MIAHSVVEQLGPSRSRGIVFAAGGSADIILAKAIAAGLVRAGCDSVDLAQPLNCSTLAEKGLLSEAGEHHALIAEADLEPELVLRHYAIVPCERHPDHRRGKGLSISSSLEWRHGSRYVCAAHGGGPRALAARRLEGDPYYDFAIGVDGGGDVLTHGDDEFDCVVVAGFRSGWQSHRPLLLIAMGLGADGGSPPASFQRVSLPGWKQVSSAEVDGGFVDELQADLERLGLWHPEPASWKSEDPYWGYGFKVPQIIALAVRGEFPFPAADGAHHLVQFPRRRELKVMDQRLLREARLFASDEGR